MTDMIAAKIKKAAENNPDKKAYQSNGRSITYKELWNEAEKFADYLMKEGTGPVLILESKEIEGLVSIVACLIANRPYVPLNATVSLYRLKKIVEMAGAHLLITHLNISIEGIRCMKLSDLNQFANQEKQRSANKLAYIIFTSGSTGNPKGVPISKHNLINFIEWISSLKPLSEYKDCIVLNQADFSFDLSVADIYYSLCNGHTLIALNDIGNDYNGIF